MNFVDIFNIALTEAKYKEPEALATSLDDTMDGLGIDSLDCVLLGSLLADIFGIAEEKADEMPMRSLKDQLRKIRGTDKRLKRNLSDPKAKAFYEWCMQCSDATLEQDIITLRNQFESGWQDSYTPPPKIAPKITGFTQALNNLMHRATIKEATAEHLLAKAQQDMELHNILVEHTMFKKLIHAASIETKKIWTPKT